MSVHAHIALLSENSVLYSQLQEAPTQSVGQFHLIDIPCTTIAAIRDTIGEKITNGNIGSIYQVRDCSPARIYKFIPENAFKNGDEIRIAKIASDLMLAPTFYSACFVKQSTTNFVMIEMNDAGLSLGKWTEKLAEPKEEVVEAEPDLTPEEAAFRAMMKKFREQYNDGYVVTEIKQPEKLSLEETIKNLYPSQETFYFILFSKIKALAESNISYRDTHVGNIMPNIGLEIGMQLIDFDEAAIVDSVEEAAKLSMQSAYTTILFMNFAGQPNLSKESQDLIDWFRSRT